MPSRFTIVAIVLFWLGTAAAVGYRDVWPRLFSDGPPPVSIDLADEATQSAPTRWRIFRGEEKVGDLTTRMEYLTGDDTFRYVSHYRNLSFRFFNVTIVVPSLDTVVRLARDGSLREQHMTGTLEAQLKGIKVAGASAVVDGYVVNGELVGRCQLKDSPFGDVDRPLDPVPVPAGQVLNPMMPVNRLRDVQPGRRWTIRLSDPLADSLAVLMKELAGKSQVAAGSLPKANDRELLAEVRSTPETIVRRDGERIDCWVIEYRGDDAIARTWVSRIDGRVLRQEATGFGDTLRFERDD